MLLPDYAITFSYPDSWNNLTWLLASTAVLSPKCSRIATTVRCSRNKLNEAISLIQSSSHLPSSTLKPKSPHTLPSLSPAWPPAFSLSACLSIHVCFYCFSWNRKGWPPSPSVPICCSLTWKSPSQTVGRILSPHLCSLCLLRKVFPSRHTVSYFNLLQYSLTPSFCLLFFP